MQKECAACGAYFETEQAAVKYCPECRAGGNPTKLKYKADHEVWRSIREYGTGRKAQPRRLTCGNCGKEFETWDRYADSYCSDECRNEHAIKNRKCARCGKLLYPAGIICEKEPGFCSEECRDVYTRNMQAKYLAAAREQGYLHECPNCGKTFVRQDRNAIFCSRGCHAHAVKSGWRKEPSPHWEPCRRCGKMVWTMPAKYVFCCAECSRAMRPALEAADRKREAERARQARKAAWLKELKKDPEKLQEYKARQKAKYRAAREAEKARAKAEREARKTRLAEEAAAEERARADAYLVENGLCAVCRTPYCDCERMQSDFRIIPEGAKYGMNGKIRECPKFRG